MYRCLSRNFFAFMCRGTNGRYRGAAVLNIPIDPDLPIEVLP